jgi:WD40 repeat protein
MNTFEITIQRQSGDSWPIVVEHSRPGELLPLRSEGSLKLSSENLQELISLLGQATDYGTLLGKALFRDEIRDAFVSALSETHEPLRVLLFIEASDKELRTLRWEKLCAPIDGGWQLLALSQRVPFSFYIPAITDRRFPPIGRRDLRALVLVASPSDSQKYNLANFDVEASINSVKSSLGEIRCDILAAVDGAIGPPTLDELCTQLTDRTKQYTLLHFVSHGRVTKDGETALYWSKADNTVEVVTATRLLERLKPLRGAKGLPHFTFLCTCESASPDAEGALGGLGQRLVRDLGMPAVVAMTERVTVKTAQTFIEKFYFQLRASGEVDSALHEATAALAERGDVTVPALYSRLGGRPLFNDQLDRELTNAEIEEGLKRFRKLLPERAPTLQQRLEIHAQKLGNSLGADITALSKAARQEREQALEEVNNLCQEILDLNFNALALGQQPPTYDARCPFLGLYPFREEDREFFFGREQLITQLQQKLSEYNFLAVLGASGGGKSSAVLAGLIPALQQQQPGLVMAYLTPSNNPIEQLQTSLLPVRNQPSIIVIDQFEELFTLCTDEAQRVTFIQELLNLSQQQKVVITMRADFWGECAPYRQLKELMQSQQELIAPMDAGELRKAMEMQAAKVGLRFEAGLSNTILDDVQGEPGAMPLLQHALLEMWKRRHGRWLRTQEYEAIGGVKMAIAQTADDVYNSLSIPEQDQVKNIFIRLTRLDESALQGEKRRDTRRRVWLDELVPAGADLTLIKELVNRLAGEGARLVVTSVDGSTHREEVEVAHEALIRYWPRLLNWLDENRTNLQLRETIRQAALEWEHKQKDENYLVHRGGRLEDAQVLSKQTSFLNQREANYVTACVELRDRIHRQEEQRRRRQLMAAVSAAFILGGFAILAGYQWRKAEIQQIQAFLKSAEAHLASNQTLDARIESLRAGKALKQSFWQVLLPDTGLKDQVLGNLSTTFYAGQEVNRLKTNQGYVNSVAIGKNGQIATAGEKGDIRLWNTKGERLNELQEYEGKLYTVAFSQDGQLLAASGDDGVSLWDTTTQKWNKLPNNNRGRDTEVAFSPDGQILSTGGAGGTAHLWNTKIKKLIKSQPHQDGVNYVAFSPDGQFLATIRGDNTAELKDTKTQKSYKLQAGNLIKVTGVVFSPDSKLLAAFAEGGSIQLWSTKIQKLVKEFNKNQTEPNQAKLTKGVFSANSNLLAAIGEGGSIQLWNIKGQLLAKFQGHPGGVESLAFSPDGQLLVTSGGDRTVRLWDISDRRLTVIRGEQQVDKIAFSPDSQRLLATVGDKDTAYLWDTKGKKLRLPQGHQGEVKSVAFSPDGQLLSATTNDGIVRLWDDKGKALVTLSGYQAGVDKVAFSADGQHLAVSDSDGLWLGDTKGGKKQLQFQGYEDEDQKINSVVFSPDGQHLAVSSTSGIKGSNSSVWLGDTKGQQLVKVQADEVNSMAFSPDSQRLVTGNMDGTIQLWDTKGQQLPKLPEYRGTVMSVAFSPDGQRLAIGGTDGTTRLWSIKGQELAKLQGHLGYVISVAFSSDGKVLATSDDTVVRLYQIKEGLDELLAMNCDWVRDYLKNPSADLSKSDPALCHGISTASSSPKK